MKQWQNVVLASSSELFKLGNGNTEDILPFLHGEDVFPNKSMTSCLYSTFILERDAKLSIGRKLQYNAVLRFASNSLLVLSGTSAQMVLPNIRKCPILFFTPVNSSSGVFLHRGRATRLHALETP